MGWGTRVYFFFFFFFFQKVASNPTEYREDHFKLYPQVILPVSLDKKKLLLESNSKGTIFSYRLGGMGEGEGEGEFLRSHGFRSEGDYRKLTAIRGGTMIISQSLGWGGRGVQQ